MRATEYSAEAAKEIGRALASTPPEDAERLVDLVLGARRIFVAGAGRSGLVTKAFAMRLAHLGLAVFVAGDATTPSAAAGDLLIVGSGSGETAGLVAIADKAKAIGMHIALVTVAPDSRIARLADAVVRIPAPTPKAKDGGASSSIQPMGTLFEQTMLVLLDGVVLRLMERTESDAAAMFARHANLE
jgi:6-phospho-3-hexuloisomerase